MRRMVLSESVRSEKGCTPLSATRLRRSNGSILCGGALPEHGDPLPKRFIPEFPTNCTSTRAPGHARIGSPARLRHSNRSGNETGICRR
jgi:hypothetical protein